MLISEFDYDLPPELIARYPAKDRRSSRLLAVTDGIHDLGFADLPSLLRAGDLLVFNDTRVIKARLTGRKESGGKVEVLIERIESDRLALAHVRASKSPKPGGRLLLDGGGEAVVAARDDGLFLIEFSTELLPYLDRYGEVPLPPYLEREADATDIDRYQTVYAKDPGAVAAPTAGLHFDEAMLAETLAAGVRHAHVTLHVGAGTFQSLRDEHIEENRLHSERVEVGETDLFILPGYAFRSVDAMITNFHLPQSSLLMLVAAFSGKDRIFAAYEHAVREKYRFFSYGDAMFLTPEIHV
jgi:S-adenosylmethionine:tRNA ribosyltransferase-isomerase